MPEFFLLNYGTTERFFARRKVVPSTEDEWCTATIRHRIFSGAARDYMLNGAIEAELKHSNLDHQIIWTQDSECLVHQELGTQMLAEGFTGFAFRPARVRFRDGHQSDCYQRLLVTGWGGLARKESGIELVKSCSACAYQEYSRLRDPRCLIDEAQWSGEDCFFVWPLPRYYFVTARLAKVLKARRARTARIQTLEEMADHVTWMRPNLSGNVCVGSLADRLPQDLANRYGGPLGIV